MKIILAISSILVLIQTGLAFFILIKSPNQLMSQRNEDKIKTNPSSVRYESFEVKTTLLSSIIFAIAVLVLFLLLKNQMPIVHNKIIMTIIASASILSSIYVLTGNYRDLEALKSLFNTNKPVSIAHFSYAGALIGGISMLITSRLELTLINTLSNDLLSQWIRIGYTVLILFIFIYLTASITIEIIYICKNRKMNSKILTKHHDLNVWLYGHIPSRSYIRKYKKWKPSRIEYWTLFVKDCVYKFLLNILLSLENIFVGTYKAIIALLKIMSSLLSIHYKSDDIFSYGSYKRILGWCFIISLTFTFFIINSSSSYSSNNKEAYSFIAGIIIIPTIIGSIIQRAHQ